MKTRKTALTIASVILIPLVAQANEQTKAEASAKTVSSPAAVPMPSSDRMPMAEFKRLLASGNVVVIDVRGASSYTSGHIPGALSMPEETLSASTAAKLKAMGKPIALYCS